MNNKYEYNPNTAAQAKAIAIALPEEERRESRLLWPIQALALGGSAIITTLLYLAAFIL